MRPELDRYITHWAVTVQNNKANNTQTTHQTLARPVISCSQASTRAKKQHHSRLLLLNDCRMIITHITGWRAYLGTAQHNYAHWTRVALPEGTTRSHQPGKNPRSTPVWSLCACPLISWRSFELNQVARRLLRDLAVLCEEPTTTTKDLVNRIAYETHMSKMSQTLRNISPRWPQCTLHPEPNAHIHDNGPTLPRHPATAHGHLYVWTTIYQCSAQRRLMKLASPCKALAQSQNLGNQSSLSSNLKAASLDIGKSREDAMRLQSDT